MIAEIAMDPSPRATRTRDISSLLLSRPVLTVRRPEDGGRDTVIVTVTGPLTDHRSYWSVRASEERYRNLIHYMPNPLLRVDARAMVEVFTRLRAEAVYDLDPYLDTHPELIDFANQTVRVTEVNRATTVLFGATRATDLIGPVGYLFEASPDTIRRIMIAHFEGRRSHAEVIRVRRLDGRLLDVQLAVTYPTPPDLRDVMVISLDDVTDRRRSCASSRPISRAPPGSRPSASSPRRSRMR
jgi:two-component system sensor kinase FixL